MSGKRAVDYDFSFKNKDSFFSQFKNTCEYYHSEKTAEKIANKEHIKYNKEFTSELDESIHCLYKEAFECNFD